MFLKKISKPVLLAAGLMIGANTVLAQNGGIGSIIRPGGPQVGPRVAIDPWGDNEEALRDLQRRLDEVRRDERRLSSDISDLQRRESQRRSESQRSRDAMKRSEGQLNQVTADAQRASAEVTRLQGEVTRARDLRDQEVRQLTQTIAQIQSEIPRLDSQLQQLESQVAQLDGQRNPKRIEALRGEIAQLQAEVAQKDTRIKELEVAEEKFKNCSATECIPHLIFVQNELKKNRDAREVLNKEIGGKNTEIAGLESIEKNYQSKVAERNQKQAEVQEKRVVAMNLQMRLSALQNQVIPQEAQLAQAQVRASSLEAQKQSLMTQVERARADLQTIERDIQDIVSRLQAAQQARDLLAQESRQIERQISDIRNKPVANRVIVAGSSVQWQLSQELSRYRLTHVSAEVEQDVSPILNARDSVVYVLADSINPSSLKPSVLRALTDVVRSGGLVIVVGDPDRLTTTPDSQELAQWIGVESAFTSSTSEVSGSGLLRGVSARGLSFQRTYELRPKAGAMAPEAVLQDSSRRVIGTASSVSSTGWQRGRILVLGLELQNLSLVKHAEGVLCANLNLSSEGSSRDICR